MTRYGAMGRTRPKKLTPKVSIPIFREDEVEIIDDEIQSAIQQIETGVEKAEESEFHLQVAINAAAQGKIKAAHIPTPETTLSTIRYDELYRPVFSQPATYIRFSSTVEDCCGCPYNMTEEDDVFLKGMNQKRDASSQCTEDQFEDVMWYFEETAQTKQPFAAVDNPPVLSYAEMEDTMDISVDASIRKFAKDIYEHWNARRTKAGNRPLLPSLKFETGQDTDDIDPYVCFRRREVRQIRKTRGRDAQSAEKLKRLRKELEDARQLVALVRHRELARREMLSIEKEVFLKRSAVKEHKRKHGIKDDDEDLINQKPKKKSVEVPGAQRPVLPQLRMPQRSGVQVADDLQLLEEVQTEKENEILRDIKLNIAKHIKWNEGYVDHTRVPLSPSPDRTFELAFRPAITAQLPTPPSSDNSESMGELAIDVQYVSLRDNLGLFAADGFDRDEDSRRIPSFRRRIGRGGRLMIDRRNLGSRCKMDVNPFIAERFKYDQEDSDEEPIYECDKDDIYVMHHRATMAAKAREQAVAAAQAHAQAQAAQAQAQAQAQRRLQADHFGANNGPAGMAQSMSSNPGPGSVTGASA